MAANNETKVQKSNTLEQWRVATNTVSHHVGDVDLLDARLTDGLFTFTGDGSTTRFGFGTDTGSKTLRIELQPENPVDSIAQILLTGSPSLTGFVADVVVFQGSVGSETFTGQINYINANKIVLRNTTGTFNPGADLKYASNTIGNANLVRLISESYDTGYAKVQVDGVNQVEEVGIGSQLGYHILNYSLEVVLSGSPSIPAEFTEGAILTQSGGFVGTILEVSATHLRFKTHTGTFATNTLVQLQGDSSKRILAANLSSATEKDTAIGNVIEFHTAPGSGDVITIDTQNLVDSITEVQDDVGNISLLGTTNKGDIVNAINELETAARGANSDYTLGTTTQNFRDAINELETASRGNNANYTLGTNAQNFRDGINELETAVRGTTGNYTIGTDSNDLVGAVNEIETILRNATSANLNTPNSTLNTDSTGGIVGAINELELRARGNNTNYNLGTTAQNFRDAINELNGEIGNISTFSGLASDVSAALVQLHTEIGDVSASNMGTTASNVTSAIFELEQEIDTLNTNHLNKNTAANVSQDFDGSVVFKGDLVDFSNTTALFSAAGGVANFGSAFLNLNSNSSIQGLQVDRTALSGSPPDVRIQFNEGVVGTKPDRAWQVSGLNHGGTTEVADIVTFYNAEDLVANNTESGISVTWDSGAQNFDFNVNDPTLTFTSPTFRTSGDLGSGTITNLASKSFVLTADTLDLGDNEKIKLGGSNDLQLYHDGSNSYIQSATGTFNITTDAGNEFALTAANNGAVTLFHDGVSRLNTSSVGIGVTGAVIATGEIEGSALDINGAFDIAGNGTIHGNTTVGGTLAVNGNVTLGNSTSDTVTIAGDLIVQGDETKLNVSTLEVEDILILTGSSTTTLPTTGGFGFETKLFSGRANQTINGRTWSAAGKHPNAAGNVTGSHSIVFNFGYDPGGGAPKGRWEMDGSPLLSAATLGSPNIEGQTFEQGDNLNFVAGTGMSLSTGKSGTTHTVTFSHDRLAPNEAIYKNIQTQNANGTLIAQNTANSNNDTLIFREVQVSSTQGIELTNVSGDIIGIQHADTSSQGSVNNSGGTVIQDIFVDTYGHTTSIGSIDLDTRYYRESEFNSAGNVANSPVLRNSNRDIFARRFDSTESDAVATAVFVGRASNIVNQANSATIACSSGASANFIALRDGSGDLYAVRFRGNGDSLTNLNASNITSGTINAARVPTLNQNTTGSSGSCTGQANTIASQANSATINATSSNSGNQIVLRNASGSFSAGTITASLTGNVTGNVTGSSGSCTGNAATATTASNSTNVNVLLTTDGTFYQLAFTSGTGNNRVRSRTNGTGFRYQPSTDTLTGSRLNANLSGSNSYNYNNLTNKPTIPAAANNGTITVNQNGVQKGQFTVNQSGNTTINLTDTDTNTNTTYSAGTGMSLSGTTFSIGQAVGTGNSPTFANVYATGDVIASYSDERLKDIKGKIRNALDKVNSLDGFYFMQNDVANKLIPTKKGVLQVGISAQKVKQVLPEVVADAPIDDRYMSVQYEKMVPLLIEAIKELTEQNKEMKAEIESLKSINS